MFLSCNFTKEIDAKNIARYGDHQLTEQEFLSKMKDFEKGDSFSIANKIINDWAIEKILIDANPGTTPGGSMIILVE